MAIYKASGFEIAGAASQEEKPVEVFGKGKCSFFPSV